MSVWTADCFKTFEAALEPCDRAFLTSGSREKNKNSCMYQKGFTPVSSNKNKLRALLVAATAMVFSVSASATIIYDSTQASTGTGFGTQNNILTLKSPGGRAGDAEDVESGKVAWNGVTSSDVLSGGRIVSGSNKTATFTFGNLGITEAGQLLLLWNPNEQGSTAGQATRIDRLILSVYEPSANQSVVFSDSLASPVLHPSLTNPGLGGDDFAYVLDMAAILGLNNVLSGLGDFSAYRIGLESMVSFVDAGPDTWTIGARAYDPGIPAVPEPGTLGLLLIGLVGIGFALRKRATLKA